MVGAIVAVLATARPLVAQNVGPDHAGQYARVDIEYGAGLFTAQCVTCHGTTGDAVGGVSLRSGKFRTAITDRDLTTLITTGIRGTAMPGFKFNAAEIEAIIAYLRNMNSFDVGSVTPGDARRGQAVFEGKGGCLTCHRVGDRGSYVAPNLSEIGALRPAGALQRSLVDPTTAMLPINRPVRVVTKDGRVINGRRLNEDTYSVQLMDAQERLVSLMKADLREFTIATKSPMPSYKNELGATELADLMAYLLSLKGS